jgi:hypothetical protein
MTGFPGFHLTSKQAATFHFDANGFAVDDYGASVTKQMADNVRLIMST